MAMQSGSGSAEKLMAQLLLLGILAVIFGALITNGADDPIYSAAYTLCACVLSGLLVVPASNIALPLSALTASILLTASVVSGLAGNWHVARTEILELATGIALFTVGAMCGQTPRLRRLLQTSLLAGSTAYFVLVLLLASLSQKTAADLLWNNDRLAGTFASPNTLAAFCSVAALLALSLVLDRIEYLRQRDAAATYILQDVFEKCFLSSLVLLSAMICLLLTGSRAGNFIFFALAMLMTLFSAISGGRKGRRFQASTLLVPLFVAAIILVAVAFSNIELKSRLDTLIPDAESRKILYTALVDAWQQSWLTGHGLGSMGDVIDEGTTLSNAAILVPHDKAHNVVLQWLVQTGVIGTVMAGFIVGWMLLPSLRLYLGRRSNRSKALPRAIVFVFAFFVLHGLVDYALEIPALMWILALLMGVGEGASRTGRTKEGRGKNEAPEKSG